MPDNSKFSCHVCHKKHPSDERMQIRLVNKRVRTSEFASTYRYPALQHYNVCEKCLKKIMQYIDHIAEC